MIRSLRKGYSSAYFQHEHTGHSIRMEKCECEIKGNECVVRLSLKPVDGNQRLDEEMSLEEPIKKIQIDDAKIAEGMWRFHDLHREKIAKWRLQVVAKSKILSLVVTVQFTLPGTVHMGVLEQ